MSLELALAIKTLEARRKYRALDSYFPDEGPLRRELYKKHLDFFALGLKFEERLALAANRIGKTESMGGYEMVCHLTGQYPKWWNGRRFQKPIDAWCAGKTGQTTRDILQEKLLGPSNDHGSGLIPRDAIYDTTPRPGIPNAVDTIYVRHVSGGISKLGMKSFDQKRQSFEGTKKDVIWLDEECDTDIYTECLLRTTDTSGTSAQNGIMILTFTPLMGLSELVLQFLPGGSIEERTDGPRAVLMATWDDVPHLTSETKRKLLSSIPEFQRDARSKGVPQLGSGAIFPVAESDLVVPDFELPAHWPRAYGMDVGWNRTAVPWGAIDRESDILYLYSEHYRGQAEPSIHAEAIKGRGAWIPGVIDPAARGRSQRDGLQLMQAYKDLGLDVEVAINSVEAGLLECWQRMSSGRLKVFKSLGNWLEEYRMYRRDEKGQIVKSKDHLMDATRYLVMSGLTRAKTKPVDAENEKIDYVYGSTSTNWMG